MKQLFCTKTSVETPQLACSSCCLKRELKLINICATISNNKHIKVWEVAMKIQLQEPQAPRYLYINPENNLVHLLVPLVGGQEISTDNTCKATTSLNEFFEQGAALRELTAYQSALEFDLQFLDSGHPPRAAKQQRLNQIKEYLKALPAMKEHYLEPIALLLEVPSNVYSIQLRPSAQDPYSKVLNPLFSINRLNDEKGTPLSALYQAMHRVYPTALIAAQSPQERLNQAVLASLPKHPIDFEGIQKALTEHSQRLFGLDINVTQDNEGKAISQQSIDNLMGFDGRDDTSNEDYIDALLGISGASALLDNLPTSPFYKEDNLNKAEKLSILTQFFLAQVNIYCAATDISSKNFGHILDASSELSDEVVGLVLSALNTGVSIEHCLCDFITHHKEAFGLNRALTDEDKNNLIERFNRIYATVTATKENPHMDDFIVLDLTKKIGQWVIHQGSICTDFSALMASSPSGNDYFKKIRADFEQPRDRVIPHKNEHIQSTPIEISTDALLSRIKDDEAFNRLPKAVQDECRKSPAFQQRTFLHDVAKGRQEEAEQALKGNPHAQKLLISPGAFTDYSGRTFQLHSLRIRLLG